MDKRHEILHNQIKVPQEQLFPSSANQEISFSKMDLAGEVLLLGLGNRELALSPFEWLI